MRMLPQKSENKIHYIPMLHQHTDNFSDGKSCTDQRKIKELLPWRDLCDDSRSQIWHISAVTDGVTPSSAVLHYCRKVAASRLYAQCALRGLRKLGHTFEKLYFLSRRIPRQILGEGPQENAFCESFALLVH